MIAAGMIFAVLLILLVVSERRSLSFLPLVSFLSWRETPKLSFDQRQTFLQATDSREFQHTAI